MHNCNIYSVCKQFFVVDCKTKTLVLFFPEWLHCWIEKASDCNVELTTALFNKNYWNIIWTLLQHEAAAYAYIYNIMNLKFKK